MNGIIRIDSYFLRVKTLLKDHEAMLTDLAGVDGPCGRQGGRLKQLYEDLADIPSAVCLRPRPLDMEIIPGNQDPERKIWGNIQQIHREQRACHAEIRHVEGEIREIERLIAKVMRLDGQPGRVLRALYIDHLTWEQAEIWTGVCKAEISRYRNIGIGKLANRLYSKIKTDFENPN